MKNFEVMLEDINPCGGPDRPRKEFLDVSCDDPRVWVEQNARYPITECNLNADGDLVITPGDVMGLAVRYTFSEY